MVVGLLCPNSYSGNVAYHPYDFQGDRVTNTVLPDFLRFGFKTNKQLIHG